MAVGPYMSLRVEAELTNELQFEKNRIQSYTADTLWEQATVESIMPVL
jgi:hypothetical protein